MKIHLIRSTEVSHELFLNVVDIRQQFKGGLNFYTGPFENRFAEDEIRDIPFEYGKFKKTEPRVSYSLLENLNQKKSSWKPPYPDTLQIVSWKSIFDKCESYRSKNNISNSEAVVFLTDYNNDNNWFSGADPNDKLNFFVHTGQWEYYLTCDARFPVAYETIAAIFRKIMFGNFKNIQKHFHNQPRGCVNDFCLEKKQITFKLRTGDLCPDCHDYLIANGVDTEITNQFFQTIDHIRAQMLFRERYKTTRQPSRIEIKGIDKKIFFTDLGNAELKLSPLEKIVYLLFLDHPEGLQLNQICDHEKWLEKLYSQLGTSRDLPEFKNSIRQLTDPTENSVSEKISRIRSKIIRLVGDDLAPHYFIEGPRGEKKKISLDRALVVNTN